MLREAIYFHLTSRGHSMKSTNSKLALSPIALCQPSTLSLFRGKPSIKNFSFPDLFMALSIKLHVIWTGTIEPFFMWVSMSSPNSDPGLVRSSRSRSPAERWTKPYSLKDTSWIRFHRTTKARCGQTMWYLPARFCDKPFLFQPQVHPKRKQLSVLRSSWWLSVSLVPYRKAGKLLWTYTYKCNIIAGVLSINRYLISRN